MQRRDYPPSSNIPYFQNLRPCLGLGRFPLYWSNRYILYLALPLSIRHFQYHLLELLPIETGSSLVIIINKKYLFRDMYSMIIPKSSSSIHISSFYRTSIVIYLFTTRDKAGNDDLFDPCKKTQTTEGIRSRSRLSSSHLSLSPL